jgi:hypothetical protein
MSTFIYERYKKKCEYRREHQTAKMTQGKKREQSRLKKAVHICKILIVGSFLFLFIVQKDEYYRYLRYIIY